MYMKKLPFILSLLIHIPLCGAEIHHCINESGKVVFKDNKCSSNENSVKIIEEVKSTEAAKKDSAKKPPKNIIIEDGRPGKLIFSDNKKLSFPYKIKVNEVRIITETDDQLVIDVIYTYKGKIPSEEIKIFVTPNHGYWSTNQIQASNGTNVARATIGLSRSNMKKDRVTRSFTNTIGVRFEHYKPKKYIGKIWSEIIKFEKNWKLKDK